MRHVTQTLQCKCNCMIDQVEARTKDIMFTKKANAYKKKGNESAGGRENNRAVQQTKKIQVHVFVYTC